MKSLALKILSFSETTILLVVLIVGAIAVLNLFIAKNLYQETMAGGGNLGGPDANGSLESERISSDSAVNLALLTNKIFPFDLEFADSDEDVAGFIIIDNALILNKSNPLSNILPTRDGLMIYKVQEGDNLSKIAADFGISLNTIIWANSDLRANLIKPGQEIVILPVSGAIHQVQDGETLESIASLYAVDQNKILEFNEGNISHLTPGSNLIIPGAKPKRNLVVSSISRLPDYADYFVLPTTGWNWGRLHSVNAVDIAKICGTPIYAAAEGLVEKEFSSGWNDGYGEYVLIEHPNPNSAIKTKYAHLQKITVSAGDYVLRGDLIGYMGNTGNTHGPTGCHLHFEVLGARNPFAR